MYKLTHHFIDPYRIHLLSVFRLWLWLLFKLASDCCTVTSGGSTMREMKKMFTIQLPSLCRRSFQWALSAISKSIIHFIVCKYICGFDFSLSSFFFGLPNTNFLKPKRHSNTHSQTQTFYSWCEFRSNSCVFFLFISLNYAFFLLVFIQHQLDYIMKSGKLKSKIKTYQIWKYRIACTGLVIYFEFKAKKPANSNENFNAIKQKKVQRQMLFYYRPNQQWTLFMHQFDEWRIMMNMI